MMSLAMQELMERALQEMIGRLGAALMADDTQEALRIARSLAGVPEPPPPDGAPWEDETTRDTGTWTIKQAALWAKMPERALRRMVKDGGVPCAMITGKRAKLPVEAFQHWVNLSVTQPPAEDAAP